MGSHTVTVGVCVDGCVCEEGGGGNVEKEGVRLRCPLKGVPAAIRVHTP